MVSEFCPKISKSAELDGAIAPVLLSYSMITLRKYASVETCIIEFCWVLSSDCQRSDGVVLPDKLLFELFQVACPLIGSIKDGSVVVKFTGHE